MEELPKIYVFLNRVIADVWQYVAVAEDGFCLASFQQYYPLDGIAARKLGEKSIWAKNYRQHYPDGYQLEWIKDINAPENLILLNRIREKAQQRADQRKQEREIADHLIQHMRTATPEEVEALRNAQAQESRL